MEYNHRLTVDIRNRLGVTQRDFAEILNVQQSTIARWEIPSMGNVSPSLENMGRMYALCKERGIEELPIWKQGDETYSVRIENDRT